MTPDTPTSAVPAGPPIEIVATLRIDGPCDDAAEYLEITAVTGTTAEAQLIEQLRQLAGEVGIQCASAVKLKHPGTIPMHVTAATRALRSMMRAFESLCHHRHGSIQPTGQSASHMARSDALLKDLILHAVGQLTAVGDHCKKERLYLCDLSEVELAGVLPGLRRGLDRRGWISKFRDLENVILSKGCDFTAKIVRLGSKNQTILVSETSEKRAAKHTRKRKAAAPPKTAFAVAVNVKKASHSEHDCSEETKKKGGQPNG
jgi:hypothetical protein